MTCNFCGEVIVPTVQGWKHKVSGSYICSGQDCLPTRYAMPSPACANTPDSTPPSVTTGKGAGRDPLHDQYAIAVAGTIDWHDDGSVADNAKFVHRVAAALVHAGKEV
jgi:hypothetical protein